MLEYFNQPIRKKGFTLAEVILAIFLLTTGIIGTYTLIAQTISSITYSSNKLIGAYLAQEGIEIVRNLRDSNWLDPATISWDEGLLTANCDGIRDSTINNGCRVDYNHSYDIDKDNPLLPLYNGEYLNIDSNGFYSYSVNPPFTQTNFKRKIVINSGGVDILNVWVRVEWETRGKTYNITAQEDLYNWH
jgi:hypothetical protein